MSQSLNQGPVTFDYPTWIGIYPEFVASVNQMQGASFFTMAQLYCDNTVCSPVSDGSPTGTRAHILYMLTSHIATLLAPTVVNGQSQAPSPLVGRISNASEGSVSVATEYAIPSTPSAAWFMQTKYGAMAWQAMAPFRTMRYASSPRRYLGVAGPYSGGWSDG